ncbi:MAG TPA: N-acetylglucosamine-6-phosphate deacetylase [Candidatus Angelobacter sp.]|nr:N-acetylglucosamine-6-phosphate deacetylase [Candidatus Angelobacter sp.]
MVDESVLIQGLKIVMENGMEENGYIRVRNGKISEVGSVSQQTNEKADKVYTFSPSDTLIPGFIDVHIHGVDGADTMDATLSALDTMAKALPREGTTSFLATTITQEVEAIEEALENVANYLDGELQDGKAEVLGVHLEGPFISKEKAGAQPLDYIIPPEVDLFRRFQEKANHSIKLVTLAPEEDTEGALTRYLKETDVVASIGHSNGTYHQLDEAIRAGASHVTHLFNGMTGLHHREPGVVGTAFLRKELATELIVDGIHSSPQVVKLAYQQIGEDRLILITDSIRAKGLKDGVYDLGGQEVQVKGGKAELPNGSLAGSVLKMADAIKNMMTFSETDLQSVVKMASVNPAKQLKVFDRKGSIAVGKDADLVVLDENNQVTLTFCRGRLSYSSEDSNLYGTV